jgi:hypothetical protein
MRIMFRSLLIKKGPVAVFGGFAAVTGANRLCGTAAVPLRIDRPEVDGGSPGIGETVRSVMPKAGRLAGRGHVGGNRRRRASGRRKRPDALRSAGPGAASAAGSSCAAYAAGTPCAARGPGGMTACPLSVDPGRPVGYFSPRPAPCPGCGRPRGGHGKARGRSLRPRGLPLADARVSPASGRLRRRARIARRGSRVPMAGTATERG